jgi:hypothetical protein
LAIFQRREEHQLSPFFYLQAARRRRLEASIFPLAVGETVFELVEGETVPEFETEEGQAMPLQHRIYFGHNDVGIFGRVCRRTGRTLGVEVNPLLPALIAL